MDKESNTIKAEKNSIILYSQQTDKVIDIIYNEGVCYSKREYVIKKYGESAHVFLSAYDWFVKYAPLYIKIPEKAQFPYWAFKEKYNIEASSDSKVLILRVPVEEAVFFNMYDWNKILCMDYLAEDEKEERSFKKMLADYGIKNNFEVVTTGFYPEIKKQIQESWLRLFKHHQAIQELRFEGAGEIQAGLFRIKKEWIIQD